MRYAMTGTLVAGLAMTSAPVSAATVCPAFGHDTDCGTILTISDTGLNIQTTGQGPYDGIDDTLVGVVNNSSQPVFALGLRSTNNIFGFDGDGVDTYGAPGNSADTTGYGGPSAAFANISTDTTTGTVNVASGVAAHGGMTYFSLENALSSAIACRDIVNNSVTHALANNATQISAAFTSQVSGLTIAQAAQDCGFKNFDWQQRISLLPPPSPFFAVGNPTALTAPPPFNDPPQGGYTYQNPPNNAFPFYYNLSTPATDPLSLAANETATTLSFFDAPADPCLPGPQSATVAAYADSVCGGMRAPAGSQLSFTTHLVGVLPNNGLLDLGVGFTWTDTYNGTSGGIAVTN